MVESYQRLGDKAILDQIITGNLGLVGRIVAGFPMFDQEELFQEGVVGLIHGINNFDLNVTTRFSTFAYRTIRGTILTFINRKNPAIRHPEGGMVPCESLDEPISERSNIPKIELLLCKRSTPEQNTIDRDIFRKIRGIIQNLEQPQRQVVIRYYFDEITVEDIAGEMGLEAHQVVYIRGKGLAAIRKGLHAKTKKEKVIIVAKTVEKSAPPEKKEPTKPKTGDNAPNQPGHRLLGGVISGKVAGKKRILFRGHGIKKFLVKGYSLITGEGDIVFTSSALDAIKSRLRPGHKCVINIEGELRGRNLLRLIIQTSITLNVDKKNIVLEIHNKKKNP